MSKHTTLIRIAAIMAALGVALGAFGAHGLADILTANQRVDTWKTASLYHLIHALAMFIPQASGKRFAAAFWFMLGIIIFSGSLYLLSITNIGWLGAITPIGGVCFLIGWGRIALTANHAKGA